MILLNVVKEGFLLHIVTRKDDKLKEVRGVRLEDIIKDMNEKELEIFKKERYGKFIKPSMELNHRPLKNINDANKLEKNFYII